jgi:TP901 family phage tail tape measure protein
MADTTIDIVANLRGAADKAIKRLKNGFQDLEQATRKIRGKGLDELGETLNNTSRRADSTTIALKALKGAANSITGGAIDRLTTSTRVSAEQAKDAAQKYKQLGQSLANVGSRAQSAGLALTALGVAAAAPFAASIKQFAEFEQTMARVRAITDGISNDEFVKLTARAREMGETTVFTAQEAAEGMIFLAQAGLDANQQFEALPGTLTLAAAGALSLAEAADIATNVISASGLAVSELGRVNDILAKSASTSNTNVSQLGQAFKVTANAARSVKLPLEDTGALLSVLANNGTKGAEAGTAVRNMLIRLARPVKKAQETLDKLGVSTRKSNGELRNVIDILKDLGTAGLSLEDSANLFGTYTANAGLAASANADLAKSFRKALQNAEGFAEQVAAIQLDTVSGDFRLFVSAAESLATTIGELLAPAVRSLTKGFTELVRSINAFFKDLPGYQVVILQFAAGFVVLVAAIGAGLTIISLAAVAWGSFLGIMGGAAAVLPSILHFATALTVLKRAVAFLVPPLKLLGLTVAAIEVGKFAVSQFAELFDVLNGVNSFNAAPFRAKIQQVSKGFEKFEESAEKLRGLNILDEGSLNRQLAIYKAGFAVLVYNGYLAESFLKEAVRHLDDFADHVKGIYDSIAEAGSRIESLQRQRNALVKEQLEENLGAREKLETKALTAAQTALRRVVTALKRNKSKQLTVETRFQAEKFRIIKSSEDRIKSIEDRIATRQRDSLLAPRKAGSFIGEASNLLADSVDGVTKATTKLAIEERKRKIQSALALVSEITDKETSVRLLNQALAAEKAVNAQEVRLAAVRAAAVTKGLKKEEVAQNRAIGLYTTRITSIKNTIVNVKALLVELAGETTLLEIDTDIASAMADLKALEAELATLTDKDYDISLFVKKPTIEQSGSFGGAAGFKTGGSIPGYGGGDRVPAMLEAGEFVVRKERASLFGSLLRSMNSGSIRNLRGVLPGFHAGGFVTPSAVGAGSASGGGGATDRMALDLTFNGSNLGSLEGSRDTVLNMVDALNQMKRGM